MDFVVIGLGLSALALLTGLTLLCMVAPRWSRQSRAVQPADAAYARALAGERHALGQGFLCVGAVLLLATLGGISAGLADKAGAYLIAAITTVAAIGLFGWDLLYRRQHPVPRRRRVAPARAQTAAAEVSPSSAVESPPGSPATTPTAVRRRVLPARHRAVPAAAASDVTVDDERTPGDEQPNAEVGEPGADVADPQAVAGRETETGPESQESAAAPRPTEEPPASVSEEAREMVSEEAEAGEPAEGATELPQPVPFVPTRANGAAEPAAASASGDESDFIPAGDDRVIALFPTAAARRGRMIVAPADPDGKN
ncbi:MAG: hypothetical protein M3Z20_19480 [Chloroflexota bacterium]|nr:hypothetical protein [Chloroflexota bacterium]